MNTLYIIQRIYLCVTYNQALPSHPFSFSRSVTSTLWLRIARYFQLDCCRLFPQQILGDIFEISLIISITDLFSDSISLSLLGLSPLHSNLSNLRNNNVTEGVREDVAYRDALLDKS